MARLTNEHLHSEIKLVKQEVEYIKDNQEKIDEDHVEVVIRDVIKHNVE